MQTTAQVGSLTDVRLRLRIVPAQNENGGSGRGSSEGSGVAGGNEFQTLGEHLTILVAIKHKAYRPARTRVNIDKTESMLQEGQGDQPNIGTSAN